MSSETYWTALLLKVRLVEIAIAQDNHLSRFAFTMAGFLCHNCACSNKTKEGRPTEQGHDESNNGNAENIGHIYFTLFSHGLYVHFG